MQVYIHTYLYLQNTSSVSSCKESVNNDGADVATILGSMRFFKKRAGEYFDELQKERKAQAELRWELEVCAFTVDSVLILCMYVLYTYVLCVTLLQNVQTRVMETSQVLDRSNRDKYRYCTF